MINVQRSFFHPFADFLEILRNVLLSIFLENIVLTCHRQAVFYQSFLTQTDDH